MCQAEYINLTSRRSHLRADENYQVLLHKVQLQSKENPQEEKNNFGINTWTPMIELGDTSMRRKGRQLGRHWGHVMADTKQFLSYTYSTPRDAHAWAHARTRVHTGSIKDLLWMKKHSDPLTRPKQQLALSQSCAFKIRIFWIIDFRSEFFFQLQF